MNLPLTFFDFSLWIAIITIILLVTVQLLMSQIGKNHIRVNRKRLKKITYIMTILFIIISGVRIINAILFP